MNEKDKYPILRAFIEGRSLPLLSATTRRDKINLLSEIYGEPLNELIETFIINGISFGICIKEGCDYTIEVELDCTSGHCEVCGTDTV